MLTYRPSTCNQVKQLWLHLLCACMELLIPLSVYEVICTGCGGTSLTELQAWGFDIPWAKAGTALMGSARYSLWQWDHFSLVLRWSGIIAPLDLAWNDKKNAFLHAMIFWLKCKDCEPTAERIACQINFLWRENSVLTPETWTWNWNVLQKACWASP